MAIHIGSKGNGARKHADLGRHPKEFDLSNLTAVGQNTSSDAVNGEAQLLRNRMKDPRTFSENALLDARTQRKKL